MGNMGMLLGMAATGSTLLFFVDRVLKLHEWASFAVIPFLFSGLLYLPLLRKLAASVGKHRAFRYVLVFQILVQPLLLIVPPMSLASAVAVFLVLGAVHGAATFLPLAMIADLKDARTENSVSHTGIYVALLQSTSKVSAALAVALMFVMLPLTGFDPSPEAVNDDTGLLGLRYMIVLLPVACYVLAWIGMRGYEYDRVSFRQTTASITE